LNAIEKKINADAGDWIGGKEGMTLNIK